MYQQTWRVLDLWMIRYPRQQRADEVIRVYPERLQVIILPHQNFLHQSVNKELYALSQQKKEDKRSETTVKILCQGQLQSMPFPGAREATGDNPTRDTTKTEIAAFLKRGERKRERERSRHRLR